MKLPLFTNGKLEKFTAFTLLSFNYSLYYLSIFAEITKILQ